MMGDERFEDEEMEQEMERLRELQTEARAVLARLTQQAEFTFETLRGIEEKTTEWWDLMEKAALPPPWWHFPLQLIGALIFGALLSLVAFAIMFRGFGLL